MADVVNFLGYSAIRPNAFLDGMDFRPPPTDEIVRMPERQDEVRPAPEPIWPPQSWWDERGVMPSTQRRIGQAQAFAGKALDWWGIPSALLSRVAPQAESAFNDVAASHPTANTAGSVAGLLLGLPVVRAAGNKVAEKGYHIGAQAGADAATAIGLGMTADAIRHGSPLGPSALAASHAVAPAAAMNRIFMPNLPNDLLRRSAVGAVAGAMAGVPSALIEGNTAVPLVTGAVGGLMAAGGRPSPRLPNYTHFKNDLVNARQRDRARDISVFLPLGLTQASTAYQYAPADGYIKPGPLDFNTMTRGAQDFVMTKDLPEWSTRYPTAAPLMPEETAYADLVYPPAAPVINDLLRGR